MPLKWASRVTLTTTMPRKINQIAAPVGSRTRPRVVSRTSRTGPKNGRAKYQTPSARQTGISPKIIIRGQSGRATRRGAHAPGSSAASSTAATALARAGATARTPFATRTRRRPVSDTTTPLLRHAQDPLAGHQAHEDRNRDEHPLLPRVEPDHRGELAQRLDPAVARREGERDLPADAGRALPAAGQLGMLAQQVALGVHDGRPAAEVERAAVPVHDHQRLPADRDRRVPGHPQQPLVVLAVAARDVLVDLTGGGPGGAAHQH